MALYQQRYEMQPTTPASAKHPTPGLENARASRPGMSQPGADALTDGLDFETEWAYYTEPEIPEA